MEIDSEERDLIVGRVVAIDVAKASTDPGDLSPDNESGAS